MLIIFFYHNPGIFFFSAIWSSYLTSPVKKEQSYCFTYLSIPEAEYNTIVQQLPKSPGTHYDFGLLHRFR